MAQTIKIAPDVILLITDETTSVDLSTVDLYLYEYSDGRKQLLFEDGEPEERTNSFGYFSNAQGGFDKVILSPTPNFYPDTHESPSFHANHVLSTVLTNPLSSDIDFINCKLMFASGYSYNVSSNALQYLSIQYRGNSHTVDLMNIYDDYSSPSITASDRELVIDGTIYNSELAFRLISVARLQSMVTADAVEFNTALFDTDTPEVLHVQYSVTDSSGIVPFVETFTFTKIIPDIVNSTTIAVSFEANEIDVNLSQTDGELDFQMIHTRFNLQSYLQAQGLTVDTLRYEIALTQYDALNVSLGTIALVLENSIDKFAVISHLPTNLNANTDYINVSVTGTITTLDGAGIVKTSNIVIPDVTPLMSTTFDTNFEVYNLTQANTEQVTTINNVFDAPTVIEVERPVYLQKFSTAEITLYPVKQVLDIVGVFSDTLENNIEFSRQYDKKNKKNNSTAVVSNPLETAPPFTIIQIGSKQYKSIDNNPFRYEIDEFAHAENVQTYLILDDKGLLVTSGSVSNVKI